jgi:two-component system sensor histidine kinase KdpD
MPTIGELKQKLPRQSVKQVRQAVGSLDFGSRGRYPYPIAFGAVVAVALPMLAFRDELDVLNVGLIFLMLVFGIALFAGSGPASAAAVLSFVVFDALFIPPYHTLTVARSDHVFALFVYLGVAFVTGQLVSRVRSRTEIAEREQRRTALHYELDAALIGDVTLDAILNRIVERVVSVYGAARSQILLPDNDELTVRASFPYGQPAPDRQRLAVAAWAMEHRTPAGKSAMGRRVRLPHGLETAGSPLVTHDEDVLYLPVATAERVVGVLEVGGKPGGGRFGVEDEQLLTSFANQAALALERARLSEEAARAAALAQSDELKTALLSAVSHDLRTPLAAIKASATSLLDTSVDWDDGSRRDFLEAIDEETDRLTLMVGNLLDLSRIEGGALRPDREWYDAAELIADVARRLTSRAVDRPITTDVQSDLPPVWLDYVEISQVLMNLCENALKFTPAGTPVRISARRAGNAIEFAVADEGPGIPDRKQTRLFEKFYRADEQNRVPGAGIGLAISRGLVDAHGGTIWIESHVGTGTTFRFTIPLNAMVDDGG